MKSVVWLSEEDLPRWDHFVATHPLGSLYHTSVWGTVLARSFPHIHGSVCALVDARSRSIIAGIPVYTVKSWLLGDRLVSIPFATLCDPLISTTEELNSLLAAIRQRHNEISTRYCEIRTHLTSSFFHESGMRSSHSYFHHFIRLNRTDEMIRRSFGRTAVRQMISKAETHGITVLHAKSSEEVDAFQLLLSETRLRLGLPPIPLKFFRALWEECEPRNGLALLLARHTGRIVGGVLALKWKNTFSLEYAGDNGRFRKWGVVQLLYWEAIKTAVREGYGIFSLGRTYRGNHGLMRSKAHWRMEREELCTFYYPETTHKDAEDREASIQYRLIKALTHNLPQSICRLLGDFCYKHMG